MVAQPIKSEVLPILAVGQKSENAARPGTEFGGNSGRRRKTEGAAKRCQIRVDRCGVRGGYVRNGVSNPTGARSVKPSELPNVVQSLRS
eukprot:scaffold359439_cov34-Prasinocladus_malaysianus.AAC.1